MSDIILKAPDTGEFDQQASVMVAEAQSLTIRNNDDYEQAAQWLISLKGFRKQVWDTLNAPVVKAREAYEAMRSLRDRAVEGPDQAEGVVKKKMGDYQWLIAEEQRKDREKKEAEARAKAEADRKKEIAAAKKLGDKQAVEALKSAPIAVSVGPSSIQAPSAAGVSGRKVWKVVSIDEAKLPRQYLMPNEKLIRGIVARAGDKHGIPGVAVVEDISVTVRG